MQRAGLLAMILAMLPLVFAPGAAAYEVRTIEISEGGFNPAVCQMNREYLRFVNVGRTPRRVLWQPPSPGSEPLFDSGWLEPGEASSEVYMGFPGTFRFVDYENPEHFVIVKTPVYSATWAVDCSPDPAKRPPAPPCTGTTHCLRVPMVASDRVGSP